MSPNDRYFYGDEPFPMDLYAEIDRERFREEVTTAQLLADLEKRQNEREQGGKKP